MSGSTSSGGLARGADDWIIRSLIGLFVLHRPMAMAMKMKMQHHAATSTSFLDIIHFLISLLDIPVTFWSGGGVGWNDGGTPGQAWGQA